MLKSKKVPLEFQNKPTKFKKYFKIKTEKAIKFCSGVDGTVFASQEIKYMPIKQLVTVLKIVKPLMKKVDRKSKIMLNLYPNTVLTKKPKDIRMGRGKGAPSDRVAIAGHKIFSLHNTLSYSVLHSKLFKKCLPKVHAASKVGLEKW